MSSRWLRLTLPILGFCALGAGLFVFVPLYRSLPDRGGRFTFPGLAAAAAIKHDDLGVVRISAYSRRDTAKLLGFVHAQNRFFQMDLLRRTAAGELAALVGPAALPVDRQHRRLGLREIARAALERLPEPHREIVEDYALGATAGLIELESPPFEYHLLNTRPEPWKTEDCFLVIAAMALQLQRTDGEPELSRAVVRDTFAPAVAEFLLSAADDLEAALDGSTVAEPNLPPTPGAAPARNSGVLPAVEPASTEAARHNATAEASNSWLALLSAPHDAAAGSNAFALRGQRGERPVALLANDLHLPLALPNTWYRAEIVWRPTPRTVRTLNGITLPGFPLLIAGTNGNVAWGFTNAFVDTSDLVPLELDPANPRRYRTPDGWQELVAHSESLAVNGGAAEILRFDTSIWGPVIGTDHLGRPLALRWVLADPAAYDLELAQLEDINSARAALAFAKKAGMPQLNIVVADREGGIGWTVAGRLPKRVGFDGAAPVTAWADGTARWEGWHAIADYPQVYNPPSGRIWSANNRMVGGPELALLGDGGYRPAGRARRIRDLMAGLKEVSPEALLGIQLDTQGLYLERWQRLLVATLDTPADSASAGRAELLRLARAWGGRAEPDSAGYRLVRDFRTAVMDRVDALVFARCRAALPRFDSSALPLDRVAHTLATARPAGWHPQGEAGWHALLLDAADSTIGAAGGAERLADHTLGRANRLQMRHPLASSVPVLGRFLAMPADELPGDPLVVRAQGPTFGASVRFVIQPGWETGSLLHMPGGQSGHPLSSYFDDRHEAWVEGEPTPLLPGRVDKHQVHAPPAD